MNNVSEPPEPGPWRLSKTVDASDQPFPNLGDVPSRPDNLPSAEALAAEIEELKRAAVSAPADAAGTGRPSAADLGAPAAADLEPVEVPPPPPAPPPLDPVN